MNFHDVLVKTRAAVAKEWGPGAAGPCVGLSMQRAVHVEDVPWDQQLILIAEATDVLLRRIGGPVHCEVHQADCKYRAVVEWNDAPERRKQHVLDALDECIAEAAP